MGLESKQNPITTNQQAKTKSRIRLTIQLFDAQFIPKDLVNKLDIHACLVLRYFVKNITLKESPHIYFKGCIKTIQRFKISKVIPKRKF